MHVPDVESGEVIAPMGQPTSIDSCLWWAPSTLSTLALRGRARVGYVLRAAIIVHARVAA
jgi:hypothetical protein